MFFILFFLCITHTEAAVELPEHLIHKDDKVCVKKMAEDGCNHCQLDFWPGRNWSWSCTDLGCIREGSEEVQNKGKCQKYLPLSQFETPDLEGQSIENCLSVLLKDKGCDLLFDIDGFSWKCKKHSKKIETSFEEPLCVRDWNGKDINQDKLQKLSKAEKTRKDKIDQEKHDSKKICVRYESDCYRLFPAIYPPQTNQNLANSSIKSPKYAKDKMRRCRLENKEGKSKCVREIEQGDLPEIQYNGERHWLSRNEGIKLEDKCVRYENDCFIYYIGLVNTKEGFKWIWFPKQKNCSKEEFKNGGNGRPMSCTSHYRKE